MQDLTGKVALVTGAARRGSIGRAIVRELTAAGATVAINDYRRDDEAEELANELKREGLEAVLALGDITSLPVIQTMVANLIEQHGRIDILVNNAGFAKHQEIAEVSEADWQLAMDLHLKAPFFLSRECAVSMRRHGFGRIINISSEQAYIGEPMLAPYTAAKGGMRTLTKSLALAWAPTITVNTVCPGPTATDKFMEGPEFAAGVPASIPLQRWVRPVEVAKSVHFLASPSGEAFTGQTLDPNCGAVMN